MRAGGGGGRAGRPGVRLRSIAAALLAALTVACGPAGQETPTWTLSSDGVEMGRGDGEMWELARFGRFLPDGRAVVADARGLFLRVFGPDGRLEAEMGRSGDGPGEFRSIFGLWITPEGRIGVWDARNRRLTIFDAEGRLVDTRPVRPPDREALRNVNAFLGAFSNRDVLLAALPRRLRPFREADEPVPERWILARFGSDGEFVGSPGELRGMRRLGRGPVPFTPVPRVVVRGDSIWLNDGHEPAITVRGPGGEDARVIDLGWTARPTGEPWSSLDSALRGRERPIDRSHLERLEEDEIPRTDEFPAVAGLLEGDAGGVWVKKYDPAVDALWLVRGDALNVGPGGEWGVLRPDGEEVATVRVPDGFVPLDVQGDRVLGVARGPLDVDRVVVRRVER